jgi:hypothetical protein
MAANPGLAAALQALAGKKFDASKHARGQGGKFAATGGGAKKPAGAVASAHGIFDKLKGKPKAEMLAAAQAAGINANTAKTQLYHWQKKQAAAALGGTAAPTKAELQAAAAKALGVKQAAGPVPKPAPTQSPKSSAKPTADEVAVKYHAIADGPGTAEQKQDKLTKKLFDDMDSVGPTDSIQHFQDAYEGALTKIKKQGDAEVLAKAGKGPTAAPKPPTPVAEKPNAPDLGELGPTKYVHALADHMKGAEKKAVIAAAVSAGVNKSTAGVQYGKWAAKQAGTPPQLAKSPEPAALQAKQPQDMSDKELDKALDSYQGKISTPNPTASYAPESYKHADEYTDYQGGKALTAKLGNKEVYTNKQQGKTFFKSQSGSVYEHTGNAGPMTKVAGDAAGQYHYDPNTKIVYQNQNGVLKPMQGVKTPVFKNDQPYDPGDHVFKDDKWSAGTNGIQDPAFKPSNLDALKAVHAKAGVTYSKSSAVASYTGSGYDEINGALRASKGEKVGSRARQIDAEMAKSSFKEDTIMWRGVGQGGTEWNGSPPPAALVDHGFSSTSFNPSVAQRFSDNKTLFRVKVPKGFPGLNVAIGQPAGGGVAGLELEAEVMLPRGTTYKVVARHNKAGPEVSTYNFLQNKTINSKMDVVDLEPVLPQWYIDKYGAPK